ncbi:MAG: SHOCT domain-containing protein [Saccharolobus sp.]
MARLRVTAGVIGIISLIIPWTLYYYPRSFLLSLDWIPYEVIIYRPLSGPLRFYSAFLNSFPLVDLVLSLLGLILIIAGSITLLSSQYHPRVGGVLLLIGAIVVILDYVYDEIKYGKFEFIPVGMALGVIGGIVGIAAKPAKKLPSENEDTTGKLLKLKTLMDSGVISKEDFEAQKNKLLRGMSSSDSVEEKLKKLKSLLDSGAITQEEYERQKKAVLENIWR